MMTGRELYEILADRGQAAQREVLVALSCRVQARVDQRVERLAGEFRIASFGDKVELVVFAGPEPSREELLTIDELGQRLGVVFTPGMVNEHTVVKQGVPRDAYDDIGGTYRAFSMPLGDLRTLLAARYSPRRPG